MAGAGWRFHAPLLGRGTLRGHLQGLGGSLRVRRRVCVRSAGPRRAWCLVSQTIECVRRGGPAHCGSGGSLVSALCVLVPTRLPTTLYSSFKHNGGAGRDFRMEAHVTPHAAWPRASPAVYVNKMCGAAVMGLLGSCHYMAEQRAHHDPPQIQHVRVRFGNKTPSFGQNCPCNANMCRQ